MKLKNIAAGVILAAASVSAFANSYDLGTLDPTGFDSVPVGSTKYAAGIDFFDTWTFTISTPSATSFGAQQTFAAPAGAITGFKAELVGYGFFNPAVTVGSQQNLGWSGQLAAGTYTVNVWGHAVLKNTSYTATVSALPVPEPETYAMLLGGLALVGAVARRKAKAA